MRDIQLDPNKLKPFLRSMNNNNNNNKLSIDNNNISIPKAKELGPVKDIHLDVDDLYQQSFDKESEIQELKSRMDQMQSKLNLMFNTGQNNKTKNMDQTLNYLKERVDLLVKHKDLKGEISSIEMKQLRINILKDKIKYLEDKLNNILEEQEKRFETGKEFSVLRKARLETITDSIISLENKVKTIIQQNKPDPQLIDKIKSKIKELKHKSGELLLKKIEQKDDVEFKVIEQISSMLEQKKKELHDLETELMLDQGIVEPPKQDLPIKEQAVRVQHTIKIPVQNPTMSFPKPDIEPPTEMHIHEFELPSISSMQHDLDLDLPSPIPLEEYNEETPTPTQISDTLPKIQRKSFFYKITHLLNKK